MIGTIAGNYRIESKLGEGGMGTVYRGVEVNLDRPVAIKILNPQFAGNPAIVERFRAEAKAQAILNHPNVAILYAFLTHEGNAMMVMEFVDGENVQQMVNRRGPIPAAEAIPLFLQALAGIGAAHRVGIVHRDIKPANIMLNGHGVVKVMDFGIAKVLGERGLTRTGSQLGTVFYMSPEQVKGQSADARSDIYSLGVTLYEMLTARVPFTAESEFDVLTDHVNTLPPLPSTFQANIPKAVERAVLTAMEKKPDSRFQTVADFAAALEEANRWERSGMAETAEITTARWANPVPQPEARNREPRDIDLTRPPQLPAQQPPASRAWTGFLAGLLTILALGGGLLWYFTRKPDTPSPAASSSAVPAPVKSATPAYNPPSAPVTQPATPPPPPLPVTVTIPADTEIAVRLTGTIDGALARVGQIFPVTIETPIVAEGKTLVESGGSAQIRLTGMEKGGRFKGGGKLDLELANFISAGAIYRVQTNRFQLAGARGKFAGFSGGVLKVPPGTAMSFTLSEPVAVTLR